MANTHNVISSQVLSSASSSVVFSSIPQTYTDLVLRITARSTTSATNLDWFHVTINSNTGGYYSWVRILGNGASGSANRQDSTTPTSGSYFGYLQGDGTTANSFSSIEMYFADYANSSYDKPIQIFSQTTNAASTTSYTSQHSNLFIQSTAISSLSITTQTTFASGSTFVLYGIKNS